MAVEVSGVKAYNCGSAVIAEGQFSDLKINDVLAVDCLNGVVLRDGPSVLSHIGLPGNTPPEALIEALKALQAMGDKAPEAKAEILKTTGIAAFIENSANATTVISNLIQIAASPLAAIVIAAFS